MIRNTEVWFEQLKYIKSIDNELFFSYVFGFYGIEGF